MKFVTLTGGLGNQLFIYAFCVELRKRGFKSILFKPYLNHSPAYGHQGYELKKVFNVNAFDGILSYFFNAILVFYTFSIKIFKGKLRTKLYQFIGIYIKSFPENFIFYPEAFTFKHKHEIYRGTFQSEKYFENSFSEVRLNLRFQEQKTSLETQHLKAKISEQNSISLHIRRGDYLSDKFSSGFAGICNLEYYERAVQYIKQNVSNPVFYIFTDDIEWVKENFKIENSHFVIHNSGKDSWQDMYLMSNCKHNIIANSTFSWWGAWLNNNQDKIVIAPKIWWNHFTKDDVVPDSWIRL
jgi:hypothetical protein